MVAFVIVGSLVWLRGGAGEHLGETATVPGETSAPDLTTLPPTTPKTTVTATSEPEATTTSEAGGGWLSMGEPVSDDEFEALFLERPVPGTARRLAWTVGYDGQYTLGLFAAQMAGQPYDDSYEEYPYCLFDYASTSEGKRFGGSRCVRTAERFAAVLAFGVGGSGRCVAPVAHAWYIWGVPESAESVVFELSDGTRLTGENVSGVALVATGRDVTVDSISFEGITAAQLAEIEELTSANRATCAEMNDPDLPG
ncbi:MAG: hypothetical protein JW785_08790 [Acidimicrobiia bacterium]|nr:hypothetical protein [Acidimicrobiia bacterium]